MTDSAHPHEHDAAGCLDCSCNAAPWSSRTPCTCPMPMASAQWRSHDAPFGHCAGCGQDLPISTGGDGDVIMSLGYCADCGLTTAWSPVNLVTESAPPEEVV